MGGGGWGGVIYVANFDVVGGDDDEVKGRRWMGLGNEGARKESLIFSAARQRL